jgi:hypothetical protein
VNVAGVPSPAELDAAAATGARQIRLFAHVPVATAGFQGAVAGARARGMGVVFALQANTSGPATDPASFAQAAGDFARAMARAGGAVAYEVFNEPDEPEFWGGPVDIAHYVRILKATAPRIRSADPGAKVLLGPLTGNNHVWLRGIYRHGGRSSFDGVAVHTDTACLVNPPSTFMRENGRISRFSFLGFRTVRDVMVGHGDSSKRIWMTELGWSTATTPCARGMWAGLKPAGVTEDAQAAHLTEAYRCLARYPYVETGLWFNLHDTVGHGDELDNYGLLREDGTPKPSWQAFRGVATTGAPRGPCGDLAGPRIRISAPTRGARFSGALVLRAIASDSSGVARVQFRINGRKIRNYTGADVASGRAVGLDWQGAKRLPVGRHVITVVALDPNRNVSTRSVGVRKIAR